MMRRAFKFFDYLKYDPKLVIFGLLAYMGSSFGQTFFIGIFTKELRLAFDLSHGGFGAIYSAATLLSALVILWTAQGIDRLRLHFWTMLVITTLALGCGLLAVSWHLWVLFAAIFCLRQGGQGLLSDIAFVSVSRYFAAHGRARAIATISFGIPLAESFMPLLAVTMIAAIGWRGSWGLYALFLLIFWLPLCLSFLRGHHLRHADYAAQIEAASRDDASESAPAATQKHYRRIDILRDFRFYLLIPILLTPPFVITGIFFHQVYISDNRAWDMLQWASLYPLYAMSNVLTAMVCGAWVDRRDVLVLLPVIPLLMGVACFLLIFPGSFALAAVIFMLIGMTAGTAATAHGVLWAEIYGTKYLGAVRSLALFLMVLASAASPIVFGMLFDQSFSIAQTMGGVTIYTVLAGLAALVCQRLYRR